MCLPYIKLAGWFMLIDKLGPSYVVPRNVKVWGEPSVHATISS